MYMFYSKRLKLSFLGQETWVIQFQIKETEKTLRKQIKKKMVVGDLRTLNKIRFYRDFEQGTSGSPNCQIYHKDTRQKAE